MNKEKLQEKWQMKIEAYALKNAISHEGEAKEGAVLSGLFNEGLEKQNVKEIMPLIKEEVKRINSLSLDEQNEKFSILENETSERKEREGLPELENVKKGKIITRFAPEPSKYLHLGHAVTFLLNYMYAKKYGGKCKLRLEDANPEKVKQEYVDSIKEDLKYLGVSRISTKFVSDDMSKFYKYAEKLINKKKAYMCFCKRDTMAELRKEGRECPCSQKDEKENLENWKKWKKGDIKKGILRLKGNMQSKNYTMRDPVIFRKCEKEHYRLGKRFKVWPLYDFYNAIEDSFMGITHIFRSNEFAQRNELQDYLRELFGMKNPEVVQYGRTNVIGATTKGREVKELIESGKYLGWDDPRLMTLKALKRRGIIKETFYELVRNIGLNQKQSDLDFNIVASINRKLIDNIADRYSFCERPVKLKIPGKRGVEEVEVKLHPEKLETRKITIKDLYIPSKDFEDNKGKEVRLMNLFNVKLGKHKNGNAKKVGEENRDVPKINWVSDFVNARVLMDNGEWISGFAEKAIKNLKKGEIIQFERFGFVKLDNINEAGEYEFYFAHR